MSNLKKYFNTLLSRISYHNGREKPLNKPNIFTIETTSMCNLACIMCPYPTMERPKALMDEALFKKIVDNWTDTTYLLRLHGLGEPLLDKRIVDFINYASKKGVKTEISTNCTVLTEDRVEAVLKSDLHQMILSLDGAHKKTYETVRKKSDFDRVVKHIHNLFKRKEELGANTRIILQIILMDETAPEVDEFIEQWKPYQKKGIINELRIKRFSTWAGQVNADLAQKELRYYPKDLKKRPPCLYLWESIVVLQDGRVVPCCFDYEGKMSMGNLHEQSLEEIWHGPKMVEFRKKHMEGDFDNDLCRKCSEYPHVEPSKGYPLNKKGIRSLWTWLKVLLGRQSMIVND